MARIVSCMRGLVLIGIVTFAVLDSDAQVVGKVATGTPAFGSFGGGPFDTVNLGNLNTHFSIPVLHKAGRGTPFTYDLSYDSSIWTAVSANGVTQWEPVYNWGWRGQTEVMMGYLSFSENTADCYYKDGLIQLLGSIHITLSNFVYHDPWGQSHYFAGETNTWTGNGGDGSCPLGADNTISATTGDGSGYSINGTAITSRSGKIINPPININSGSATATDANGNQINVNSSGQFFDTLSGTTPALTVSSAAPPTPTTFTYTAPSGGNASFTMNYTQYTVATDFGWGNIAEYPPTSVPLVSSIDLPDGNSYSFSYEATSGSCTALAGTNGPCITGRINVVTLPTGGKISYTFRGGSNGVNYINQDGTTGALTRVLSSTTTAPSQTWEYDRGLLGANLFETIVTDPNSNQTVIDFSEDTSGTYNFYETQRQVYQGSSSSGSLLAMSTRCYNDNYATCNSTVVSSPITQTDVYSTTEPNGVSRLSEVLYNAYGLVYDDKEFNYGVVTGKAPGKTDLVRETAISYASLGNGIVNKPSSVIVSDWTSSKAVTVSSTTFAYDGTAVTATSGTPQHTSISGSRGNLTTLTTSSGSATSLTKSFTYYDTGNPHVATDVNGAQTTYVYSSAANPYNSALTASCGNSFATTVDEPLSLSRSMQWNCIGGIAEQVTDENSKVVKSGYTDPDFWRPANLYDQENNETTITYVGETAVEAALQNFNGGSSSSDSRTTVDGFGRSIFTQRKQGPTATNYDTSEIDYDNVGQPSRSTMPYSTTASPTSSNTTAPGKNTTYDALGRVLTIQDADGGTVSYTYTNNDVLQSVTGSQSFQKQFEYDGLGRLTSVCEISSILTGYGTCGQGTTQNGFWTKYTYDALGHLLTVTQNAQATAAKRQPRSFTYDWLGRMTSESNPETANTGQNGTTSYTYDSYAPGTCGGQTSEPGDLMLMTKPSGASVCYIHDALHRLTDEGGSDNCMTNACKRFRYDNSQGYYGSIPPGVTGSNSLGRVAEVTTEVGSNSTKVTDEWFSYSPRGELTDVYEFTPHSSVYYHTTASYWPTGTLETLSGIPSVPTINYGASGAGLDGEGRVTQVTASSGTNPVSGVTYSSTSTTNPLGSLTGITFGSADSDSFTYDPNTGRMTGYTFTVNSQTDIGALTWNTNGTLNQMKITDSITGTSDSQTCNYLYDDLQRVSSANCGALWTQNFTYDSFGNITKSGSSAFDPSYSVTQNQFTSIPGVSVSYDGNGNLLTDNLNTYTWDVYGRMSTVTTGSATVTATYDGLGRMVENNAGGAYSEFVYGPTGVKLAQVNGTTLIKAFVALPGGAKAIYNSSGTLAYFRHSDWLGSSRLTSTATKPTSMYSSTAYAPFGESQAAQTSGTADASFTGQDQDTVSSLYDFPARRYSPSQGRWISPDPLGRGAVTLANPQSWNRYAYVMNNPIAHTDPTGLVDCADDDDDDDVCGGGGGGGGGGDDNSGDDNSGNPDQTCDAQCQQDKQQNCADGLQEAGQTMAAVDRANASWDMLQTAADANNVDPALLAAIGIRETGFQNIPQSGGGQGAGIFQIDLGQNPNVTSQQAFNPAWAANFAANMLDTNMDTLAAAYPNLNQNQLLQATAASYNFGTGNISGNPNTIDVGTTGGNYGESVASIMDCF